MYGRHKTKEELMAALDAIKKESQQPGYDGRMTPEELKEAGAVDETAQHVGEGTIIVKTGKS